MAIQEWLIAAGLLALLLVSQEIGFRVGLREKSRREAGIVPQIGAVQAAVLGVLGLLLGLSFSGAASRFLEKQDLITREANAIGTAFLRADLLGDPHRTGLREALRAYTEHRIGVSTHVRDGLTAADHERIAAFHDAMWRAARDGVEAKPHTIVAVLPPVNDVIDIHSLRLAAGQKHLPILVMGLLVVCSALSMGVMALGGGLSGRRHTALYGSLALVIGVALWTTIDLDHPRAGVIRLNDAPLRAIRFGP